MFLTTKVGLEGGERCSVQGHRGSPLLYMILTTEIWVIFIEPIYVSNELFIILQNVLLLVIEGNAELGQLLYFNL